MKKININKFYLKLEKGRKSPQKEEPVEQHNENGDSDGEESNESGSLANPSDADKPKKRKGNNSRKNKKGNSDKCTEEGFFQSKKDCHKFYRCVQQGSQLTKFNFDCPAGLVFDETISVCNWPNQAECK